MCVCLTFYVCAQNSQTVCQASCRCCDGLLMLPLHTLARAPLTSYLICCFGYCDMNLRWLWLVLLCSVYVLGLVCCICFYIGMHQIAFFDIRPELDSGLLYHLCYSPNFLSLCCDNGLLYKQYKVTLHVHNDKSPHTHTDRTQRHYACTVCSMLKIRNTVKVRAIH